MVSTPTVDSPGLEPGTHLPQPLLAGGSHLGSVGGVGGDPAGVGTPASVVGAAADAAHYAVGALGRGPADDTASMTSSATSAAALAAAGGVQPAGADALLAPALLSQGTACDWSVVLPVEALGLRYGTVKRSRLGRVGISIPYPGTAMVAITPSAAAAGAAAGAAVSVGGGIAPGAAAGGGTEQQGGWQTGGGSRSRVLPVRSIKFKHVRFNRMHARLTYESPALSIRNFGLVLDNRVYRNIDGGWKTVLNRWAET